MKRWAFQTTRTSPLRLKLLLSFATTAALTIGSVQIASADDTFINFEPPAYHTGSIDGQPSTAPADKRWGGQDPNFVPGPINPAIDQAVVMNGSSAPESFGTQSWRISNAYSSGTFGDMPFSPSLTNEAGESMATNEGPSPSTGPFQYSGGTRQNHFVAQWAFTAADPSNSIESDSYVSISPDRGDGARMSYIRLERPTGMSGINVYFDDYIDVKPYGRDDGNPADAQQGCQGGGNGDGVTSDGFRETQVASNLDPAQAHTVKLDISLIDGPRNDVVNVYVDGDFKFQGTTWEDYFRWCTESLGGTGNPANDRSRTIDSLLFRVGDDGLPHPNLGRGFLIDNISYSSFSTPTGCENHQANGDADVDNGSGEHGHTNFHKRGCGHNDTDSVQHEDQQGGHSFQSTYIDSAQFNTAADGNTATITGMGLDNGNTVGFTLIAVDHGSLVPATYSLILTDGYSFIGTLVSGTGTISVQ